MLLGHLAADGSNALVDVGVGEPLSTDGDANRLQQRRRQLERVRVRDVEAVHEPRPHEVEVRRRRYRRRCRASATARARRLRRPRTRGSRGRRDPLRSLPKQRELSGRPRGNGRRPPHEAEELGRRQVGPVAHVREEVAHGDDRRAGVAHVLVDHLHVVVAAAREVCDQLLVGERVRVDRLQLLVGRDRGRLEGLVPLA